MDERFKPGDIVIFNYKNYLSSSTCERETDREGNTIGDIRAASVHGLVGEIQKRTGSTTYIVFILNMNKYIYSSTSFFKKL